MQQLSNLFKALADPTRLRIMNLLLRSPFCVCEMERILGLPNRFFPGTWPTCATADW